MGLRICTIDGKKPAGIESKAVKDNSDSKRGSGTFLKEKNH